MLMLLSKFKMLLLFLLIIVLGCGAFFLGRMQGTEEAATPAIVHNDVAPASQPPATYKAKEPIRGATPEETIEKSKQKSEQDLERMKQAIEEHNQQVEEDYKSGKTRIAAPKFKPSDVPTREPHFQN